MDFLYNLNQLNVAIRRAYIVASPELLRVLCHTQEQLHLANALDVFVTRGPDPARVRRISAAFDAAADCRRTVALTSGRGAAPWPSNGTERFREFVGEAVVGGHHEPVEVQTSVRADIVELLDVRQFVRKAKIGGASRLTRMDACDRTIEDRPPYKRASSERRPPLEMRVVAWNVSQPGDKRVKGIVKAVEALDPDLIFLSEWSPIRGGGPNIGRSLADLGWSIQARGGLDESRVQQPASA